MRKEKLRKEPNSWKLIRTSADSPDINGKWETNKRKQIVKTTTGRHEH